MNEWMNVGMHSSEKRGYMLDEMFHAIFLEYENTSSFFLHLMLHLFFPNECWHRPGHSLGEEIK